MFEFNSKNVKNIILIATYIILLCFVLMKIDIVLNVLSYIIGIIKPIIYGFCFAFILNIPLSKIENIILKRNRKNKKNKSQKTKNQKGDSTITIVNKKVRTLTIVISLFIFIGIIFFTLFLVVPETINTISIFKESIPEAFSKCQVWLEEVTSNYPDVVAKIRAYTPNWEELDTNLTETIKTAATGILNFSIDFVINVISVITNFFIGIILAIYMLSQKEKLSSQITRIIKAYIPEKRANKLLEIASITNDIFKKFFGGQFTEAIILGVLCFIGMTIFNMPYALTISVLIGVTALIPIFGAFFGTLIGAILILAVNPVKAIWFVIYIIVIQQIDGNFIYPRVVGNSVGLPAIWVMIAVLIGGSSLGIIGMIIGVPIASVIYKLLKENTAKREKNILKSETK